eukprot:1955446-Rhodomonas_salina.1
MMRDGEHDSHVSEEGSAEVLNMLGGTQSAPPLPTPRTLWLPSRPPPMRWLPRAACAGPTKAAR